MNGAGRTISDDLESLGRLIAPDPRGTFERVIERGRRRRFIEINLPRRAQLAPAVAAIAALMLVAGPLTLHFLSPGAGDASRAAHELRQPFVRHSEPEAQDHAQEVPQVDTRPATAPGPTQPRPGDQAFAPNPGGRGATGQPAPATPPSGGAAGPEPTAPAPCSSQAMSLVASTDRDTYTSAQSVVITLTLTNGGQQACTVPSGSCADDIQVRDASGQTVYSSQAASPLICPNPILGGSTTLRPGEMTQASITWNQGTCQDPTPGTCANTTNRAAPGSYAAGGTWNLSTRAPLEAARHRFTIQ